MIREGEFTFNVNDRQEIVDALREIMLMPLGEKYKSEFYTSETGDADLEKILAAAQTLAGGPTISVNAMAKALELLIDSGEIQPKDFVVTPELTEPEPDTRPRDRNGKLLAEPQLKWKSFREWAESHSAEDCRRRGRTDAEFGSFVRKSVEREMGGGVGDAVIPVGQGGSRVEPTAELADFARKYLAEPIANLRPKGGFVSLAGEQIPYSKYVDLVNRASAIRLI